MKHYLIKASLILIGSIAMTSCATTTTKTTYKPLTPAEKQAVIATTGKRVGNDKHKMPTYADEARTRYLRATAYSHMEKEVGAPGRKNAAGTILKFGAVRSAAADWSRLPLGTKFKIKGQPGVTYVVDDYGSALVGTNTIDMFYPTLYSMNDWGTREVVIQIIQMGSFEQSAQILCARQHAPHCRHMYSAIRNKRGLSLVLN